MRQASLLFAGLALGKPDYICSVVDAAGRFGRRGSRSQLLHPPAAALVRLAGSEMRPRPASSVRCRSRSWAADVGDQVDLSLQIGRSSAYRVTLSGHPVVDLSRPPASSSTASTSGDGVDVTASKRTQHDERYRTRGVHSTAADRYNGAIASTWCTSPRGRGIRMEVRAFNDGVAFRYVVPARLTPTRECRTRRRFSFSPRSVVWSHDLDGHYERCARNEAIEDVAEGDWAAPPLTAQLPDATGYAADHRGRLEGLRRHGAADRSPRRICRASRPRGTGFVSVSAPVSRTGRSAAGCRHRYAAPSRRLGAWSSPGRISTPS